MNEDEEPDKLPEKHDMKKFNYGKFSSFLTSIKTY